MSDSDPCEFPSEMLSEDVETEFVDSVEALERRIAADLRQGRKRDTDDATTDGGSED